MDSITDKCKSLENQSKRNMLIFLGLATFEENLWDDCVEKVKTVIREGVELRDEIRTKRVHRAGKAIVVKFSNQQKMLILKNARLPMNQMVLTMST